MKRTALFLAVALWSAPAGAFDISGDGYYWPDGSYFPFYQSVPVGISNEWFQPFARQPSASPYHVPAYRRPPPGYGWTMPPRRAPPPYRQGPWYRSAP